MKRNSTSVIALLAISVVLLFSIGPTLIRPASADPEAGEAALEGTVDVSALPPVQDSPETVELPSPDQPVPLILANSSSTPADLSIASSSSVALISSFEGLNQAQGGANPPDVAVATGPSHVMEMINRAGGIWNKQGTLISTFSLATFFQTGTAFTSDPKVLFDVQSGRWFASFIQCGGSSVNDCFSTSLQQRVKLAVSTTSDPTGVWNLYSILSGLGRLPDQPIIGVSDDKFVVSANIFPSFFSFLGAQYWVLNKSQMVAGAATISFVSFGPNGSLISVHPVQSESSTTTQYMVSTATGGATIWLFAITGVPPGTVSVNTVTFTASIPSPPNAVQPGTPTTLRTDDARVQSAAWYQGKLWFTLNDGCIPSGDTIQRSCVRLVQIDTSTSTILQNFDFGAIGTYYFYPALRVESTGGLGVIFGFSSSSSYPSLAITGQASNDPPRTLAAPVTIRTGSAPNTSGRYGDYFGAGVDPSDPTLLWVAGEYQPTSSYSTFIASVRVFSFTVSASPSSLSIVADTSGTSTITLGSLGGFAGTVSLTASSSPSGLFAYFSPTSVTLTSGGTASSTMTVTSSTAGSYTVTTTGTSGSTSHSANVAVVVTSFTLSVSPLSTTIPAGRSGSETVQASSVNGFSGSIALSVWFGLPTCVSSGFTKPTLALTPGGTDTSVLLLNAGSSCSASTSFVYVRGADISGAARYATFTLSISEFSLSVSPQPVGITRGTCGDVAVTIYSLNGHSGLITLIGSGFPPEISATFLTNPVSLAPGGTASSSLHLCAADTSTVGSFIATIGGSDGTISRSTTINILLNDYQMTVSSNPRTIIIGSSATNTITISKYFGATAALSLSATGLPSCITSSFSPASINLPDGGQSILTMTASTSCTVADYSVTVKADGPGSTYDKQVSFVLHVTSGGGGGGGGSVMAGTPVTLLDGTKVPVQNLRVGDKLRAFDLATNLVVDATIVGVNSVTVNNLVILKLLDGTTIRTDNNPAQKFWVMKPDGTIALVGIPDIGVGDYLFHVDSRTWVQVVSRQYIVGGNYTMFDIVTAGPYDYVVNGYLDRVKVIE